MATTRFRIAMDARRVAVSFSPIRLVTFLSTLVALLSTNIVEAQNIQPGCDERSEQVLQDCINAMGGISLVDAANLKLSGSLSVTLKSETAKVLVHFNVELVQMGYKSSLKRRNREGSPDSIFEQNSDGRTTWTSMDGSPFQQPAEMPNPPDWIPWPGSVMTWDELNKITFAGEEDIDGQACWKLQFKHVEGQKSDRYFGKVSGLPVQFRHTSMTRGENQTTFEFVKYEDWVLPMRHTVQLTLEGVMQELESKFEVVEIGFADEDFEITIPGTESDK